MTTISNKQHNTSTQSFQNFILDIQKTDSGANNLLSKIKRESDQNRICTFAFFRRHGNFLLANQFLQVFKVGLGFSLFLEFLAEVCLTLGLDEILGQLQATGLQRGIKGLNLLLHFLHILGPVKKERLSRVAHRRKSCLKHKWGFEN